jgi:hypothetical protein
MGARELENAARGRGIDTPEFAPVRDSNRGADAAAVSLVVASLFLSQIVGAVYGGLEREAPEGWTLLSPISVSVSIVAWFWSYSRQNRIGWVLDMGWFVMAAWAIVVPYYLLKREGRRGLGRIGLFLLTYFAAWATGVAVRIWVRVLGGG